MAWVARVAAAPVVRGRTSFGLAVLTVVLSLSVAPAARGQAIILTRQAVPPGAANPAIALLLSNAAHRGGDVPPCHFTGAVVADETGPDFGAGLRRLVFQPVSLAPGQSLAVDLPPTDADVADVAAMPPADRVLIVTLQHDRARDRPCPLQVGAFGYDPATKATKHLVDNLDIFILPTVNPDGSPGGGRGHLRPAAFVGGSTAQAARLVLYSDIGPGPSGRCTPPGVVSVLVIPRLDDDEPPRPAAATRSWPVKWEGPGFKSVALVEIPFDELAARVDERVDAVLSLRFDGVLPAACQRGISAVIEIFDRATGATEARGRVLGPFFGVESLP